MNSRHDIVQDPDTRRAVAIVRTGAAATIVAALLGLSLLSAHQTPGASVAEPFAAAAMASDIAGGPEVRPVDPLLAPEDAAQPPRFMGEPAVY
jgi:hypothetical protein